MQDAARSARNRLIGSWAYSLGLNAIATGHTVDDQAETFLLRLARGSGVDGLSGMAESINKDRLVLELISKLKVIYAIKEDLLLIALMQIAIFI